MFAAQPQQYGAPVLSHKPTGVPVHTQDEFFAGLTSEHFDTLTKKLPADKRAAFISAIYHDAEKGAGLTPTELPAPPTMADFVNATAGFECEEWQKLLCARLEKLPFQSGQRLLIHGPPQFGKSILVSQRFPAYVLGVDPLHRIRLACYNVSKAIEFTKVNLEIMRQPNYIKMFPDPRTRVPTICAAQDWSTVGRAQKLDAQTSLKALGVASGFVGAGADTLIIDDPYSGDKEAMSDAVNDGVWRWWLQTVVPRLNPQSNVVVMFHRWRIDDLAGRLLERGGWEHLRFAAIGDGDDDPMQRPVGVSLSPVRYPVEYLEGVQKDIGDQAFLGLFQGKPVADSGNMFKAEMFCRPTPDAENPYASKEPWPESLLMEPLVEAYINWDTARRIKEHNDFSAASLTALTCTGDTLLVPLILQRMLIPDVEKQVLLTWAYWKIRLGDVLKGAPIEMGAADAVEQHAQRMKAARAEETGLLKKHLQEGGTLADFRWRIPYGWSLVEWQQVLAAPPLNTIPFDPPNDMNKYQRAQRVLSYCYGQHVKVVQLASAPIARQWMAQMFAFPLGAHDDAVDSTVTGLEIIANINQAGKALGTAAQLNSLYGPAGNAAGVLPSGADSDPLALMRGA